MRSDLLDVEVYVKHMTDKAALLWTPNTSMSGVWVPLGWFEWATEPKNGETGDAEITISKSRAAEKGLA